MTMLLLLDRSIWHCCGCKSSTTLGDAFKLCIPISWSAICVMACLAYLISPLSRGDSPRWGSAGLVALSGLAGIGLSVAIYNFHRKTSSFAAEENYDDDVGGAGTGDGIADCETTATKLRRRGRTLRIHSIASASFCVLSCSLAVFFGAFASGLDKCAHESCGADVSWSCITLGVALAWMFVTILGYRDLRRRTLPGSRKNDIERVEVA